MTGIVRVPLALLLLGFFAAGCRVSESPPGERADSLADTSRTEPPVSSSHREDIGGPEKAVAVIRAYYAAIDAKHYRRAYRYWGDDGSASDQTFDAFRSGFSETASVDVETGGPGRVEPAAGSRYIEIPVFITAVTTGGATQRFRGTYVLRRSVVTGATIEQRQWHLYSADIHQVE